MPRTRVSFRVTILTLTTTLILTVVGMVIAFQHYNSRSIALDSAERFLHEINTSITDHTERLFVPLMTFAKMLVNTPKVDTKPSLMPHPLSPLMIAFLEAHPMTTSIYLGFEDGSFSQIVNLGPGRETVAWALKAPAAARFALRLIKPRLDGKRVEFIRFIDERHRAVGNVHSSLADYDPRKRPWYQGAVRRGDTYVTDFYPFANEPGVGVTVARRFDGTSVGVVGIDITLATVSRFLREQERRAVGESGAGAIFIITPDGKILSQSNIYDPAGEKPGGTSGKNSKLRTLVNAEEALSRAIYKQFTETGHLDREDGFERRFTVDDEWFAAKITPITFPNNVTAYIASALPLDIFLQPMFESQRLSLVVSIVIVLFFAPFVYLAAARISVPIRTLTDVARDIRDLRFIEKKAVARSFIREIDDLAGVLATARSAIHTFGKYVPKYVVRQILQSSDPPARGGVRREMSVLFTDLEGFTEWSQRIGPEALMEQMSNYLSGVCNVIEAREGIVDKFIGDAVMAYWNAPDLVENHAEKACLATLECREWINRAMLHVSQENEGERVFFTRFGLHIGEAVVGNVGSEERMDFTVFGSPINIGSRLEPLNKNYGTQIIASDAVAHRCENRFLFRWLDTVLPKGALQPMDVYELVGARLDWAGAPAHVAAGPDMIEKCEAWRAIPKLYRERRWEDLIAAMDAFARRFGEERLTTLYRERAETFIADPPPPDWNFVTVYLTKR